MEDTIEMEVPAVISDVPLAQHPTPKAPATNKNDKTGSKNHSIYDSVNSDIVLLSPAPF